MALHDDRLGVIFEMMADGVVYRGADGRVTLVNPAACRLLERTRDELLGLTPLEPRWEWLDAAGAPLEPADRPWARALRTGQPVRDQLVGMRGRSVAAVRWLLVSVDLERTPGASEPVGTVATLREVTDERRALEALRVSETRFRAVTDATPSHVFMKDRAHRWTFANAALLRAHGWSLSDVAGKTDAELFGDVVSAPIVEVDRRIMTSGVEEVVEERVPTIAGVRLFVSHKAPLRDAHGEVVGLIGAALDVTEAKRVEQVLRNRELYLATLVHSSIDALWFVDMEGRLVEANDAATTLLGYTRDELLALRIWELTAAPAEMSNPARMVLERARGLPGERFLATLRHKNGRTVEVDVVTQYLDVDGGRVVSFVRDVTEQRKVEAQLRQAQKLESMGRLAGGVAHDFNNQLTVILGSAEALLADVQRGRPARPDDVRAILQAGDHGRALTRQLLAFARQQAVKPVDLELSRVVRTAGKVLRRLLGEDILLRADFAAAPCPVHGDAGQIEQLVFNLALNARDAMPSGGELVVTTRAPGPCPEAPVGAQGRFVQLVVCDAGCGMTADVQAHLFEPFFTTKDPGKGTGLGLATVYGIVEQMGGHLHVDSEPGRGTTVTVCLPEGEDAPAASTDGVPRPPQGGAETILVVEDDPMIRRVVERLLAAVGYRVLVAEDGRSAIELAAAEPGSIDLLLSDVVMPGMSGHELAAELVASRPAMRVLHMSGYGERVGAGAPSLSGVSCLLAKPFSSGELLGRVRDLLDAGRRAAAHVHHLRNGTS